MSIIVKIANVTRGVSPDTLRITHTLFQRSVAEFTVPDKAGSIELAVGQTVEIKQGGNTLFAGTISEISREKYGPDAMRYWRVSATDWSAMCDRRLAPAEYEWQSGKRNDIFRNIVTASLNGEDDFVAEHTEMLNADGTTTEYPVTTALSTPSVYLNDTLQTSGYVWNGTSKTITFDAPPKRTEPIKFKYNVHCADLSLVPANTGSIVEEFKIGTNGETVSAALTRLCKESGGGLYWRFDHQRRILFTTFVSGPTIASISNTSGNLIADSIAATHSRQEFANVVRVFFSAVVEQRTETATGDGSRKSFSMGQEIVSEPKVRLNGVYQTVGLKSGTAEYDVFWNNGGKEIEFAVAPPSGALIESSFKGQSTFRADAVDNASIAERALAEGSSGIYEKAITYTEQIGVERAQEIADTTLARMSAMAGNVTFQSDDLSYVVPGDKIVVSSLTGIPSGTYFCRSITMNLLGPSLIRSSIEIATGQMVMSGLETLAGDKFLPGVANFSLERDAREPIPNVVIGEDAVTVGYVEIDGVLKIDISVVVTVPTSPANAHFEGCQVYMEIDGDRKTDLGYQVCTVDADEEWTIRTVQRLPLQDEQWKLYFVSRSFERQNTPVWSADPDPWNVSPYVIVEAKAQPLVTEDGPPQVTEEDAGFWNADTTAWVHEGYYDSLGNLYIEWTAKLPADLTNVSGVQIYLHPVDTTTYNPATGLLDQFSAEPPTAEGVFRDRITINAIDVPVGGQTWDVIFCCYDRAGNRTVDDDEYPTGPTVTITVPASTGGDVVPISALTLQQRLNALPRI